MLKSVSRWDTEFFVEFRDLRNRINSHEHDFLEETLDELKEQFGADAPFARANDWQAWLAFEGSRIVGRLVVNQPHSAKIDFIPCGYFECENNPAVARELFDAAAAWAKARGLKALKGPINGSFFNNYRLRLPGPEPRFLGEPVHPKYYHELFKDSGFEVSGKWDTIIIQRAKVGDIWNSITKRFKKAPENRGLRIRNVRPADWSTEMKTIHQLFMSSYSGMPDFMPITYEEFEVLYDSFRHLIHPSFVFFVEDQGKPVGFMIGLFDPLPILLSRQRGSKKGATKSRIRDAITLLRLKLNRKGLLVLYVGKAQDSTNKGITGMISKRIAINCVKHAVPDAKVGYLAEGSPTYASLPKNYEVFARYCLYRKSLN